MKTYNLIPEWKVQDLPEIVDQEAIRERGEILDMDENIDLLISFIMVHSTPATFRAFARNWIAEEIEMVITA